MPQKKTWEKSKKKKKGKGGIGAAKSKKKAQQKKGGKKQQQEKTEEQEELKVEGKESWSSDNDESEPEEVNRVVENEHAPTGKRKKQVRGGGSGGKNNLRHRTKAVSNSRAVALKDDLSSDEESDVESEGGEKSESKDDEEEWKTLQESVQKHQKKKFDSINTKSYPVHAPYFPDVNLKVFCYLSTLALVIII